MIRIIYVLIFASLGCATKYDLKKEAWNEKKDESIRLKVDWVKKKRKKMDVQISITNRYPFDVIVQADSIRYSFDGAESSNTARSNPEMILRPGDTKQTRVTFEFDPMPTGDKAVLVLDHIYSTTNVDALISKGSTVASANSFGTGSAYVSGNRNSASGNFVNAVNTTAQANSQGVAYMGSIARPHTKLPVVTAELFLN